MAQFKFQLEAVLRQRHYIEQQRQRELAFVQAQMSELQTQLRSLNNSVQMTNDDLRVNHLIGKLDMNFLGAHRRFMAATQRQAIALMQRMAIIQRDLEAAQKALAAAATQKKAIEKLRERNLQRWRDDLNRRESAELDEIATQMSYRAGLQTSESSQ
ncbi:MAG TPA: flagellar export protein FliJ [Tepidisphaeraceae bacterium]|jgi:flagellar FliJ protein